MNGELSPCEYARHRHHDIAKWRNLWSILVFSFGAAVTLFLILALLLFVRQAWIPGALSTAGTIAQGVALRWVVTRRKESVKEEKDAYEEVVQRCKAVPGSPIAKETQALAARYNLF